MSNEGFDYTLKNFIPPTFIKVTNGNFEWVNTDNRHFYSKKFNITVQFFYTMMPTKNLVKKKTNAYKIYYN